jgi:hypothetical protein
MPQPQIEPAPDLLGSQMQGRLRLAPRPTMNDLRLANGQRQFNLLTCGFVDNQKFSQVLTS